MERGSAGCGVNALSGLQERANSTNCALFCRPDKRSASGNKPHLLHVERVRLYYLRPASSSSTSSTLVVCARRSMTDSSSSALVRLVIT
ncbi:hypothetical protein BMT49_23405 [Escherichia coli]|nr:hypothetical protein BMT49_23405 [Escherichia coli]